ncbi:MAG: galactose mutarotase [Clostridiaceae bacterium]|nr:galactose mutarotase [Clostridiaceae bacterium]
MTKKLIFKTNQNEEVYQYTLKNQNGMQVDLLNIGACLLSIYVPDKNGNSIDVILGHEKVETYEQNPTYQGAIIGRYANRIGNATFDFHGKKIELEKNSVNHHLHSESVGFNYRVWQELQFNTDSITFGIQAPDGEGNYPGDIDCQVTYQLTENNGLIIEYSAKTKTETVANLTNHSYFNLNASNNSNILNHIVKINSNKITDVDADSIPTGEIKDITGTAFDFTQPKAIGQNIDDDNYLLKNAGGYDHNYVLDASDEAQITVYSPETGIEMDVFTNSPGVQFYTGNGINGQFVGKEGYAYPHRAGVCFETQFYPDAVNHQNFPSPYLTADKPQHFETEYRFSVKE